jgi:hypothetical protein
MKIKTIRVRQYSGEVEKLLEAIENNNRWYKNCKSVRIRDGLICKVCPFREMIEIVEALGGEK